MSNIQWCDRLASNGGPFFISTFKNILEKPNQPSGKEICCRGKKSKEIVENWNQRFPDTKALISIVNFGKGSE
ncbi:hypothetical protein KSY77_03885 [Holdemanella biformis]|nr:hypothetical protein [Holdemanella biformis]